MGILNYISNLFSGDKKTISLDACIADLETSIYYKELAIQTSINLIANTLARSEFQTFFEGKQQKGSNYYLFNIEPNQNKSSSKFWRDVIHNLVYHNECLIIQNQKNIYVADDYDIERYALKDNIYRNVVIDNYQMKDVFVENEVIHLELHNENIRFMVEELSKEYTKLISAGQVNYRKNNSRRGLLNVDTNYAKTETAQKDLQDLLANKFKRFYEAENGAVLPLTKGEKYEELTSNIGVKGGIEGRDIRGFIDDIFDLVGIAFNIPPVLLKGEVADTKGVFNNFMTFCINPIAELIEDETNRKYYGKADYLKGSYLNIDTTRVKTTDITDIAGSLDILLRTGMFTIDDGLQTLGKEKIGGEVGTQRFMTLNYSTIEDAIEGREKENKKVGD